MSKGQKLVVDLNQNRFHHLPIRSFYSERSFLTHQAFFVVSSLIAPKETFLRTISIGDSIRIFFEGSQVEQNLFQGYISEIIFFKGFCRISLSDSFYLCRKRKLVNFLPRLDLKSTLRFYLESVGLDLHPLSENGVIHQNLHLSFATLEDLIQFYARINDYHAFFIDQKTLIYLKKERRSFENLILKSKLVTIKEPKIVRFGSSNYIDYAFSDDIVSIVLFSDSKENFQLGEKVILIDLLKRVRTGYLVKKEEELGFVNQKKYYFKLIQEQIPFYEQPNRDIFKRI